MTGDNGLIQKIGEAKNGSKDAEIMEQIMLAVSAYQIEIINNDDVDPEYFVKKELERRYEVEYVYVDEDGIFYVKIDGKEYVYDPDMNIIRNIGKWNDNGNGTFTNSATKQTIKMGDIVNYDELSNGTKTFIANPKKGIGGSFGSFNSSTKECQLIQKEYQSENLSWRVFGVNDKGQLEIISETPVTESIVIANEEGYLNSPELMDKMCDELYGYGIGAASARNLNINDCVNTEEIEYNENKYAKIQFRFPTEEEATNTNENQTPKGKGQIRYIQYREINGKNSSKWIDIMDSKLQRYREPGKIDFGVRWQSLVGDYSKNNNGNVSTNTQYDNGRYNRFIEGYSSEITNIVNNRPYAYPSSCSNIILSDITQLLSSNYIESYFENNIPMCVYGIQCISDGYIQEKEISTVYMESKTKKYVEGYIRPIVTLDNIVSLEETSTGQYELKDDVLKGIKTGYNNIKDLTINELKVALKKEVRYIEDISGDNLPLVLTTSYGNQYVINESREIVQRGSWRQKEDGTITDKAISLKIGDYISYDHRKNANGEKISSGNAVYTSYGTKSANSNLNEGRTNGTTENIQFNINNYGGGWRVLGVENGNILLISANPTSEKLKLYGENGYIYGADELDAISSIYGQGKYAESARSIKVEDIDKITGYNPKKIINTGDVRAKNNLWEYNNIITYSRDSKGKLTYISKNDSIKSSSGGIFRYYDKDLKKFVNLENNQSVAITSTSYNYYATNLLETSSDSGNGIASTSNEYKLLFNSAYWLANSFSGTNFPYYEYGLFSVQSNRVCDTASLGWSNNTNIKNYSYSARPVIILSKDIKIFKNNKKNGMSQDKACIID